MPAGGTAEGRFELVNLTAGDEQLALVTMPCRCADFPGLQVPLPPGRPTGVPFVLRAPAGAGHFRRLVVFQTSAGDVRCELVGEAVAPR